MQDFYEELWERLPADAEGPDLARRRDFALAEARPHDRVLDLGCGAGTFTAALAGVGASVIGADVAEAALRRARQRHPGLEFRRVACGDALPFADGAFDLVWSSEVIEHVADTARWLSEVRRVLARRGRLLLTTPNHSRARLALHGVERYSQPLGDHLHLYTRASLAEVLDEFGFAPVTVWAVGGAPGLRRLLLARAAR
ncbi:MAG: class I SAM-dependent methyltransferase [Solirubrobacteraceae bacterium]